jgi:PBSX family phage terminase large subunit
MSQAKKSKIQSEAEKILWNRGILRHKLHHLQQTIYDQFYTGDDYITTMLLARRSGKTYLMCVLAIETCLRQKNAIVLYVCQTKEMVKQIVRQNIEPLIEDCPDAIKPEWKEADKCYQFKNGSILRIAGSDSGHYNRLRGGKSDLWIVDEAGFCKELKTIVRSVLSPTTATTKGRGILASTPDPAKPDHEFITEFVEPAEAKHKLFKFTIFDNPLIDEKKRQEIIEEYPGGVNNPQFQAEFMCKITRNSDSIVIPEFDAIAEKEIIVDTYRRPPIYDCYVSMDIGGKDFTVILFGYFDFIKNCVVVEDELVFTTRQNSLTIAKKFIEKQEELWNGKMPYLMFADNNNQILLNDLKIQHNLSFIPTRKDNKEATINNLRVKVQSRQILISSKCKTLKNHLKNATWSKAQSIGNYKKFAYGADGSHYDALDALLYLIRNISYGKNPYPAGYGDLIGEDIHIRRTIEEKDKKFLKVFKRRF